MKFVGISGSLRAASTNTALLRATQELLPEGVTMEMVTLNALPMLNPDDLANGFPDLVNQLAAQAKAADALILATPEYNYSISAALKNYIDWLSIHPDAPFKHKPIAIMSSSPGIFGGARAQYHLRQMFIYADAKVLNGPEIMVGLSGEKITEQGELVDAASRDLIAQQMQALAKLAS
ncbi:NADPH-dependent FMN reductase [Thiomicrospira aerophila AL3]|uniref:NADPH-dependent FMN reductase n=1 Tax=Thiomicrospira aerophila AL3 TaxID=717772 RepID=W0DUR3_9GAMM|nr:NAD(P)H-dependent oxidoreductase [Thiomicrospira aerophila]AHF02157.1 NADPH-dependent FMN reductase [Thiomicrospira aerophila AL3]